MTEQPLSGGAAFWAARGVRIEPEAVPEDQAVPEDEADGEALATQPEQVAQPPVEPEPPTEPEQTAEPQPEAEAEPEPEPEPEAKPELANEDEDANEDENENQTADASGTDETFASAPSLGIPQQRTEEAEPAWQLAGGDPASALPPLKTCLEAILMVVDEPVAVVTLAQVLERPTAEVAAALTELAEEYTVQGRGFELREVGLGDGTRTGWRVYSRAECAPVVERFVRDGQQAKLTQAALETLAVVAYRQPVSRSKVSAIRGVNCDGVMRTLLARGLVEEYGSDQETGAVLYQTTGYFLERMGLKSLEELPDLAPLLPGAAEVDAEDFV